MGMHSHVVRGHGIGAFKATALRRTRGTASDTESYVIV